MHERERERRPEDYCKQWEKNQQRPTCQKKRATSTSIIIILQPLLSFQVACQVTADSRDARRDSKVAPPSRVVKHLGALGSTRCPAVLRIYVVFWCFLYWHRTRGSFSTMFFVGFLHVTNMFQMVRIHQLTAFFCALFEGLLQTEICKALRLYFELQPCSGRSFCRVGIVLGSHQIIFAFLWTGWPDPFHQCQALEKIAETLWWVGLGKEMWNSWPYK